MEAGQCGEAIAAVGLAAGLALAERSVEVSCAAAGAVLVGDGDVNKGTDEGDVEDDGDGGGDHYAGEAAQEQQPDDAVKHTCSGNSGNGTNLVGDVQVMVVQRGQEVGVDAEDECRGEELDAPDEPLKELESDSSFGAHGCKTYWGWSWLSLCGLLIRRSQC